MMSEVFDEHVLEAPDVCQSCFRRIRVERIEPTRSGVAREYEQTYGRRRRTTEIDYGPAEDVADHKGVFCDRCGTESAFARTWDQADVHDPGATFDRERFKNLVTNCLHSLLDKGVSLDRKTFVAAALSELDDGATVDEALGRATDTALAVAGQEAPAADA
jgi:hypothetical protein